MGLAPGCLGQTVTVQAALLTSLAPGSSFQEAAAMPTVYVTALMALQESARCQRGDRVLVHAATGGVGLAAISLAEALGCEVWATAGSAAKRSGLRAQLPRIRCLDSRSLDFADEVATLSDALGVNAVLNSLTSPGMTAASLAVLRPGGRFLEIGKRGIHSAAAAARERPDVAFHTIAIDYLPPERLGALVRHVGRLAASGAVRAPPSTAHDLGHVASALRQLSLAAHVGKIVTLDRRAGQSAQKLTGSCLVTGGLGALGQLTARFLQGQGARHLVLLGRNAR